MSAAVQTMAGLHATTARKPEHRNEILCVQALRGMAVLVVLVVHVEDMANHIPQFAHLHSWYSRYIGYSAPDLFFVISGFIMSYITLGMPFRPKQWLIGRFVRIYPMYFLFSTLALLIYLWNPYRPVMGSGPHDAWTILASFMVLPSKALPLLFVGWTLQHEIVFYAIVFVVASTMPTRMLVPVMLGLSVAGLIRWILVNHYAMPDWRWTFPSLYLWQFTMGTMVYRYRAWLGRLGVWPAAGLAVLAAIGGILFAHAGAMGSEEPLRVLLFGACYTFILIALLNREDRLKAAHSFDPTHRSFAVRLGDASYSMYLCHPFVLASFGHVGERLDLSGWVADLWLPFAYVSVVACGMVLYQILEKPLLSAGRRLLMRKPA